MIFVILLGVQFPFMATGRFSKIVAFGDSITDDGIDASSSSYDPHGFRIYSNGPVWTDYIAEALRINPRKLRNYAYSGALSDLGNVYGYNWSGVQWQVNKFLEHHPQILGATLILYQAGGANDLMAGRTNVSLVAANNAGPLRKLAQAGARWILATDIMDVSALPAASNFSEHRRILNNLTTFVNRLLAQKIQQIRQEFPNLKICEVSVRQIFQDALDSIYLKNEIFDHQNSNTIPGEIFQYIWFDEYHPSTIVHKMLAEEVLTTLKNC